MAPAAVSTPIQRRPTRARNAMPNWVVDRGIVKLRDQINRLAPGRSKASDGTIGDQAHQAQGVASDHNPEHPAPPGNPDYQVDAGDFTHDPAHGADMALISEAIRRSRDRRVSYVIYNRQIFNRIEFAWMPYAGVDPHTNHMHVSVNDTFHDETQDWVITLGHPEVSHTMPVLLLHDPKSGKVYARYANGTTAWLGSEEYAYWFPKTTQVDVTGGALDRLEAARLDKG
jgi:hypothetical protein